MVEVGNELMVWTGVVCRACDGGFFVFQGVKD